MGTLKPPAPKSSSPAVLPGIAGRLGDDAQEQAIRSAIDSACRAAAIDPDGNAELLRVLNIALAALRESNRRFCDLLDNVELIALMLDLDGSITYCNDHLLHLTGWQREQVIGQNWFAMFIPPELGLQPFFRSVLADEAQARHHINDILTRSGARRLIHWNNSLLRDGAGEVIGVTSIGTDITERMRGEDQLRRFRLVMDSTADAIYLIDRASVRIIDINAAACRMLGYEREEILAMPPENIYGFPREQLLRDWDRLIAQGAGAEVIENRHRRRDGSWVPVEVERRAVRSWESWLVVVVARDISARRQAEAHRDFQVHLLNAIGEALVASDLFGTIRYWNGRAEALYGWSADEVGGRNVIGLLFPDRLRELSAAILNEVKQGRTWRGEHQARHKNGSALFVHMSVAPQHDGAGELIGLICVSRDISERRAAEKALRRSNERFELVTRATNDIVWDWHLAKNTLWWNENMYSALGLERSELEPGIESWYDLIHVEDYQRVVSGIHAVLDSTGNVWQDEYRCRHRDGHYLMIFDRGFVIRDNHGKAIRMIGAMMDITARKQAEIANHRHAMQQRLLAEFGQKALASNNLDALMDEAVFVVREGLQVDFARAMQLAPDGGSLLFKAGLGWAPHWLGRRISISEPEARKRYALHMQWQQPVVVDDFSNDTRLVPSQMLAEHGILSAVEVIIRDPSGVYGFIGAYSRQVRYFGTEMVSFLSSVAATLGTAVERVRAEEKMAYLAQFDALTRLPNRNLLRDRLTQAASQAQRNHAQAALLYIDIDRFKVVNDSYGHGVGDTLLVQIAERLQQTIRSGDTVSRLGGDEFAIVLSDLTSAFEANHIAQQILDALAQPFELAGHETFITASIGIALSPDDGDDPASLLKNADTAMHRAKERGRNSFEFYTKTLNERVTYRIEIERELRHAIERNELELHYQPQVSLDSGRIVAAEALLRWRHPQRGLLTPSHFIDIAEETGLIVPIGQWVVETACQDTLNWHRAGHRELTMAINVSPAEIRRGNVPAQIRAALERTGLAPRHLEIEITESMAMDNAESFIDTLRTLKDSGVLIAIDDFGTGYSNLSYLKRFPIDTIKIDQAFIRDIVTDTDDAAIVRALIAMAHQLKLDVVAEGVETEAQAGFLRRNQIDLVQGYLFSPPIAAAGFSWLLDTYLLLPAQARAGELRRNLLIVDDEENILRALKRTLRSDGYEIHTANSAREGLEILARTPIGVILSDERMPEMSGAEFLGRVKALYPDTVRIMLSGYTDLKVVTAAVNEGAIYKFLTKPWEDDTLREDIRQAFRRHETRTELAGKAEP